MASDNSSHSRRSRRRFPTPELRSVSLACETPSCWPDMCVPSPLPIHGDKTAEGDEFGRS